MILCSGHKRDKDKSGTGFYISRCNMDKLLDSETINVRMCKIWIKLKYYSLTMVSTHAPTMEKRLNWSPHIDQVRKKTAQRM
jgi:hypothetical protein